MSCIPTSDSVSLNSVMNVLSLNYFFYECIHSLLTDNFLQDDLKSKRPERAKWISCRF